LRQGFGLRFVAIACVFAARAQAQVDVTTVGYGNLRTNANLQETQLRPENVNPVQFGKLFSFQVDGQVYAQPLYVSQLQLAPDVSRNVLFVATMHNSVFAFDADSPSNKGLIWQTNLGPSVPAANYGTSRPYTDIFPEVGILSTPVIDRSRNKIYVVSATLADGQYAYTLHALDLSTGQESDPAPVTIQADVAGQGGDNLDGLVSFNAFWHLQRPGLLLSNNILYIAFGSHNDEGIYHGWLVGYSAGDLSGPVSIFNASPNAEGGSIWMSGHGLPVDEQGAIYCATGNGHYDGMTGFGESVLKLDPAQNLAVMDWFTPDNYEALDNADRDLGSAGPILIPNTHLVVAAGKEGVIYLVDADHMGGMVDGNPGVLQVWKSANGGIFNLALWDRPGGPMLYARGFGEALKAYRMTDGRFDTTPASQAVQNYGYPFDGLAVSANGSDESSAILWATTTAGGKPGQVWPGTLRAYSATDVSVELYSSDMEERDVLPSFAKFVSPTVANGRVFVPTFSNQVAVYGLEAPTSEWPLSFLLSNPSKGTGRECKAW
jgi:hypothetical protein